MNTAAVVKFNWAPAGAGLECVYYVHHEEQWADFGCTVLLFCNSSRRSCCCCVNNMGLVEVWLGCIPPMHCC